MRQMVARTVTWRAERGVPRESRRWPMTGINVGDGTALLVVLGLIEVIGRPPAQPEVAGHP